MLLALPVFAAIILLAFILRAAGLGSPSLWYDETYSVFIARQGWAAISTTLVADHVPLHYYLLGPWMGLAGGSEYAIRALSLLAGVLTIPLLYALVRRLGGARRAAVAAAVLAFSAFHVYYSQEARMHVLATFFVTLAAYAVLAGGTGRWRWVVYGLAAVGAIYTYYYAIFALAGTSVIFLSQRRWPPRGWWLANALTLLLWLPWLLSAWPRLRAFTSGRTPRWPSGSPEDWLKAPTGFVFGLADRPLWMGLLGLALLLVIGAIVAWRTRRRWDGLGGLVGWAVLPVLGIYTVTAAAGGPPLFSARYLLIALPAWVALAVLACPGPTRAWQRLGLVAAACVFVGGNAWARADMAVHPGWYRDDYRAAFEVLRREAADGEVLVYDVPDQIAAIDYYARGARLPAVGLPLKDDRQATERALGDLAATYRGVWALYYAEPLAWVPDWLDQHLVSVSNVWFGPYVRLQHYRLAPLSAPATTPLLLAARLDLGELRLNHVGLSTGSPGAMVIELLWEAVSQPSVDYSVSVQLFDAGGRRLAQVDGRPLAGVVPTSRWRPGQVYADTFSLPAPGGPGPYSLQVSIYDLADRVFRREAPLLQLWRPAHMPVDQAGGVGPAFSIDRVQVAGGAEGALAVAVEGRVSAAATRGVTWFAHAVDVQGQLIAQDDHPALTPLTQLLPGDRMAVLLAMNTGSRQAARIALGAYDAAGTRVVFTLADGSRADYLTVLVPSEGSSQPAAGSILPWLIGR